MDGLRFGGKRLQFSVMTSNVGSVTLSATAQNKVVSGYSRNIGRLPQIVKVCMETFRISKPDPISKHMQIPSTPILLYIQIRTNEFYSTECAWTKGHLMNSDTILGSLLSSGYTFLVINQQKACGFPGYISSKLRFLMLKLDKITSTLV